MDEARGSTSEVGDALVLLGHKGGWPVFGVDWCRDGRHLISCGGDSTIRLWDTAAVGPVGNIAKVQKTSSSSTTSGKSQMSSSVVEVGGAALCVYRGHSLGTSVWDCKFAPSGYYFASCGVDKTVRLWTTDRIAPVRVFAGHIASVGCVAWHPNCNYVLSGSDDKNVRMWDVQSGRCVRILTGLAGFVSALAVSPNGKYAVAGDEKGFIHIWDLGTGRLVQEIRPTTGESNVNNAVYTLAYSSCGSALASGGADCCVKIWDVRGASENRTVPDYANNDICHTGPSGLITEPVKKFGTKQTQLLNLRYTKRNLLMGVGKFIA